MYTVFALNKYGLEIDSITNVRKQVSIYRTKFNIGIQGL